MFLIITQKNTAHSGNNRKKAQSDLEANSCTEKLSHSLVFSKPQKLTHRHENTQPQTCCLT